MRSTRSPLPHVRRVPGALLLLALLLALLMCAPAAQAASVAQAQAKARAVAARQVESYGISYAPSMWSASCTRTGGGFRCRVRSQGGQCSGTLKLSGRLASYAIRIGCME